MKIESAEFVRSAVGERDFPRDGLPEVAFVGRSNVGKSSLLNKLAGRHGLARVSRTPGRTQAVNLFLIDRRFYFVDLPGYGYARAAKAARAEWALLLEAYLRRPAGRRRAVLLIDAVVGPTALDRDAWAYLERHGVETTLVATKIDKLPRGRRKLALAVIREGLDLNEEISLIEFSAKTGEGVAELWKEIGSHLSRAASN
jgi:GTP-binding protein